MTTNTFAIEQAKARNAYRDRFPGVPDERTWPGRKADDALLARAGVLAGTWLVETAHKRSPWTPADTPDVWVIRSGNATEAGARAEARQCGPHWRRQGLKVRVRFEPAD